MKYNEIRFFPFISWTERDFSWADVMRRDALMQLFLYEPVSSLISDRLTDDCIVSQHRLEIVPQQNFPTYQPDDN